LPSPARLGGGRKALHLTDSTLVKKPNLVRLRFSRRVARVGANRPSSQKVDDSAS
jgi:hypothetical protein